jgi:acylphosphatase
MDAAVHMVVEGLVQGVGFRWFVARHANVLGLHGFVENRYDGTVEVEAEGERGLLEELVKQIRVGPRSAQVTNLVLEWKNPTHHFTHFQLR